MNKSTNVPFLYQNTYIDSIKDFLLVYNPISQKGIVVLNKEAAFIFKQIDGKKSITEILNIAKKKDPKVNKLNIEKIFENFVSSELVFFKNPINKEKIFSRSPTHLGVWLHLTNQCNLRCTYCYVKKTNESMSELTALKALKKIILQAKAHRYNKITFKFSGGECLLKLPLILKLIHFGREEGRKNKINLDFVVLTNGVLLTKKIAKVFKQENIRVAISLDGLESYNDMQRVFPSGLGSFRFVEKGIRNLLREQVVFNVSVTISSKNVLGIPDLTKYLLKLNIPFAFNFYRENQYSKEKLISNDLKLIQSLTKAYNLIYLNPPNYPIINGLLDRVSFKMPHRLTCGMGNNYLVIRQDGKIVACQMTLEKTIGSIDDYNLIKTMKDGNFIKPQKITVEDKLPCATCQWKYLCGGGCPLLTYQQKNSYTVSSPYCEVYKALIPKILRIEGSRLIKYGHKVIR